MTTFEAKSNKATDQEKQAFSSYTTTCAVCGKEFIRSPHHLYKVTKRQYEDGKKQKTNIIYFCRYNHYVKWLKDNGRW